MALLKGKSGESYNVSANNEVDNLTIVNKILKLMNKPESLIKFVEDRPGHDLRYSLDSQKISNDLGWKIKTSFEDGLQSTINWYLNNPEILNKIHLETVQDTTPWTVSYTQLTLTTICCV